MEIFSITIMKNNVCALRGVPALQAGEDRRTAYNNFKSFINGSILYSGAGPMPSAVNVSRSNCVLPASYIFVSPFKSNRPNHQSKNFNLNIEIGIFA
jgi:hypothetical protein